MTSRSHEGPLPLELVEQIISLAGTYATAVSPALATRLQLVSRSSRKLLLPIIYFVFVVDLSRAEKGKQPPSLTFFLHLLHNKTCPPRTHIHHIVFKGSDMSSLKHDKFKKRLKPWSFLSIALPNDWRVVQFIIQSHVITPSTFILCDPQNDDDGWLIAFDLIVARTREAEQVVSIGPISSTRLRMRYNDMRCQSPNMWDIETQDKSASASTLRILLDWVPEDDLVQERQFRTVERVLNEVLEFTNASIVLELRRNDQYQEDLSMEFVPYVQKLKATRW